MYPKRLCLHKLPFDSRQEKEIVSQSSQVDPGALLFSYSMDSGCHYPGLKGQRREVVYSQPSNAGVNNKWIYASTPLCVFPM